MSIGGRVGVRHSRRRRAAQAVVTFAASALLGACFQPRDENAVMVVNHSDVDLTMRTASGRGEAKDLPSFGPVRGYAIPSGRRCLDDVLLFVDEDGAVRATLEEPCGGEHAIRPEDLDPPAQR